MPFDFGTGPTASGYALNNVGAIGAGSIGGGSFGGYVGISIESTTIETDVTFIGSYGIGWLGQKVYSWPVEITIRTVNGADSGGIFITFYNRSRGVMGRIFSSTQKPIVNKIEFTIDQRGCGDAKLTLNALPVFPLLPFSLVGIRIGNAAADHYLGYLNVDEQEGTTRDQYEFQITGLREQLERHKVDREITGPIDVGDVIEDLIATDVLPYTDINYIASKITNPTGVLATTLDFGKEPTSDALDAMNIMAGNHYLGIDADGDVFFTEKSLEPLKSFLVGWNVNSFNPLRNFEEVYNSIVVQRNKQTGSGWTVAAIRQDATSQAKYGLRELTKKVPGYFDTTTCQVIGDSLLNLKSEPVDSAKSKHTIESEDDIMPIGVYRFIAPLQDYTEDADECDSLTYWTTSGSGDLALSINSTTYLSGAGSLELAWTLGAGDAAVLNLAEAIGGNIKKVRLYIRSNRLGQYLTFGVGAATYTEYTKPLGVNLSNSFTLFEWDIESLNTSIGQIGIRVDEDFGQETVVLIDRIQVIRKDYRHYDLELAKVKYKFQPGRIEAEAEWGTVPKGIDDYISQLLAYSKANEYRSEDRT